ncbi:helix-turn-helix domain-containing protein [Dysgonomonas sp. ZJ279]|uniref:helix-turn-helix domain-containing protein n=1 Tax=Dysgonomonas sp. ZJ279 TaxID=2709796 RepID=UPI0013EA04AF|nr:helix-turn-helix domain-containing protein [Dysgonomonas sp. ZJ279]
MEFDTPNKIFTLAADIVSNTSQSVFLTGKAGTGKTTFLHHIRKNVDKNVIVAAPTGVAAINAGGVTLHSLLQLPFEPFIPNFEGKKKLEYHFKLRKSKIEMLRELDLLIIDEVSMLRADMLDAIDHLLRRYRNRQEPFGGVQMLFIGDMFQLPPVVQQAEWEQLKEYYASPFFFHAQVLNDNMPLYIELKTIYRQSDQQFIGILNRIRNNCTTSQDLDILNQRYNPTFRPSEDDKYVTLCTHNYKADKINNEELARLTDETFVFKGHVSGDFAENAFPAEMNLTLKLGAQIMFIRNDAGESRRYYNGKLATVSYLAKDKIFVRFNDDSEMELEQETWRNVRYSLNNESGEIEEEELGAFSQYPIRLAWAITIHKSQGLTFDRVVIDAGQAFAAGQVYVALSRCTTLDGIVFYSRITSSSIQTDKEALAFTNEEKNLDFLESILDDEKPRYTAQRLKKTFDWSPMVRSLRAFYELASEKKIPNQEEVRTMISQLCNKVIEQEDIARNFRKELDQMLSMPNPDVTRLKDRVQKAVLYFHNDIQNKIILPLEEHLSGLKNASKVKLYLRKATDIQITITNFLTKLENVYYGDINLTADLVFPKLELPEAPKLPEKESKTKPQKGDSQRLTLSMFIDGKSIKDIAAERNLTVVTIENHLVSFILTGEVEITQLISEEKKQYLEPRLKEFSLNSPLGPIKESLPKEYSYFDIKAMLNYLKFLNNNALK